MQESLLKNLQIENFAPPPCPLPPPLAAGDTLAVSSAPAAASGLQLVVWSREGKHIEARFFRPLDAGFRAAPATGPAPLTVVFTDTTSPLGKASLWGWSFGDGTATLGQQHTQHTYTTPGVYTVTLTASASGSGESESLAHAITVTAPVLHSRAFTYTYDALQRLTAAVYSTDETFAYAYDAVGNRTVMTSTTSLSGTLVTTHTYDAANRLTARQRSDGHAYTYDWSARGQLLIEWTQGYPVREFTYDAAGQMIRARVFTQTTEFVYNGLGDRIAVDVAGYGTTTYALDYAAGGRILAETTLTETVAYLYGHECLGEQRADAWLFYLPDAAGEVVSAWRFDPDGTVLEGPHGPVSHLICGGVYDWSTGLLYQGGRYFDPALGIWLALLPLAVVQGGRKRKSRRQWALLLGVALLAVGTLVGCEPPHGTGTATPTICIPTGTPSPTPSPSPTPTPTPDPPTSTPDPSPTPIPMYNPSELNLSQAGFDFIVGEEWVVLHLYNDSNDLTRANCTVGIGHLVHTGACDGRASEQEFIGGITEDNAYELFRSDLVGRSQQYVRSLVTVSITQYQYDALTSFVFNAGSGRFQGSNTLLHLNQGDYAAAAKALESEYVGDGIAVAERRRKESNMFQYGVYDIKEPVIFP